MKIKKIECFRLDMPLSIPYTIAYETITKATNIILKLSTDNGLTGWGCAAPDVPVTGETPEDVIDNMENVIRGVLENQSPFQIARIHQQLKKQLVNSSSSVAMVDIALHDIMARRARLPLYQLIGGYKHSIETSITIGILSLDDTLDRAYRFLQQGFSILKLKGGLSLCDDIEKVLKMREKLGGDFRLRFDANQGFTAQESIEFIDKAKKADIEIFEQPTSKKNEDQLGHVTQNVQVPVMADESIKTIKDAFRLASNDLIDMVNIKLMKVGGILESQHINSVAKAAGLEVMVGCLDECSLGISAGLHFTLSRPNIEYADLDGYMDLEGDPFAGLFRLEKGMLHPSQDDGLGKITL
jgi:L-Ala-D/L-Glu epimerase